MYNRGKHYVTLLNPSIRFKSNKSPAAADADFALHFGMIRQYGFGYDQLHDKYKVLVVMRNSTHVLTKLYTFGHDSWKTIHNFNLTPIHFLGIFVSGTLNWIVQKECVYVILSFDLEKENSKEILLPQQDDDDDVKLTEHTLYVLNNCLGVSYETNKTHWVAWLMKEYGVVDSWTKIMIIPYDKLNKQPCFPLFISQNGIVLLMKKWTSQFFLYNINTGHWINSTETTGTLRVNLHIYCESLVSVPW
ncbi:F-box/kelch-repeat protein At3g23880-like [Vicia villosa]|uniref:F-box/kelch-repeat protein At3g23880-like n=1 Tax=Vicia villosa TaxID=3911 RepID=UPI00273C3432|nr:F-box/kelch-repeat protein At3g23880-like [Vicia villosa]XP_058768180.1 F-box/kelch-repeat protein At3g23880-like [Vicia villosa]XP_058768182.1 F-box/kelch-repeat protein At3g23880-like [Vicia villosa]